MTAPEGPRCGRCVAVVDASKSTVEPLKADGITRPIDVRAGPDGAIYALDFGRFEIAEDGVAADPRGGCVWRLVLADDHDTIESSAP